MSVRDGLFSASFKDARTKGVTCPSDNSSPNCFNARSAGFYEEKLVTLTGDGDPVAVNLFTIEGLVRINQVVGVFEDVTNVADIEEVRLDVYDGTNDEVITLAAGVVCDGVTVGAALAKVDDASGALVLLDADQIRIDETTKRDNLDPVLVNGKNGATNYLRMLYKNADTNLNCQIRWYVEWRTFCGNTGLVEPV